MLAIVLYSKETRGSFLSICSYMYYCRMPMKQVSACYHLDYKSIPAHACLHPADTVWSNFYSKVPLRFPKLLKPQTNPDRSC